VTPADLARRIEHTLLRAEATEADVLRLCDEARAHGFHAVCVNACRVALAAEALAGSGVAVCAVAGFPLGATTTATKAAEAAGAVRDGASEVDVVVNLGWLLDGRQGDVAAEVAAVRAAIEAVRPDALLKAILETALLPNALKAAAAEAAVRGGAAFVKTSTGMHRAGGATEADVRLLRDAVAGRAGIKASGGIADASFALALVVAGADRLGSSAGPALIAGLDAG